MAATELGRERIRGNGVHPGAVMTDMLFKHPQFATLEQRARTSPLEHMARLAEIAAMVVYSALDESGFSTGSEFLVDGDV